jgi:hypothetical protein
MENLVIFIIIMVISSLLSRNKKKKASETYEKKEKTTYNDNRNYPSKTVSSKPVTDLRDLLDSLKNFEQAKTHQPVNKPVIQEQTFEEKFEDVQHSEVHLEETQPDQYSYEEHSKNYKQKASQQSERYEESVVYEAMKMPETIEEIMSATRKKPVRRSFFKSGFNLKQAVIASEILNRKYT